MKAILLLVSIFFYSTTLGQKILSVKNSSFLGEQVDSIKISYGKFSKKIKLNNTLINILISAYDTLVIYPDDFIPLEITGLKKVKSDTIVIDNYSLYKYCANDTIINSHEKRKLFSTKYQNKREIKIIPCNKSNQFIPDKSIVKINGLPYITLCIIRSDYEMQIACGKRDSYSSKRIHSTARYWIVLK